MLIVKGAVEEILAPGGQDRWWSPMGHVLPIDNRTRAALPGIEHDESGPGQSACWRVAWKPMPHGRASC